MKQETIEEAALNYAKQPLLVTTKNGFIAGAKWQQEKSYSEEDMREMYNNSCGLIGLGELNDQTENNNRFRELIEKIKNK